MCVKANRTLGFLRRNIYRCPPGCKRSSLGIWLLCLGRPGRVENRAARFVTSNYCFETGSMTGIMKRWESLKERGRDNRLILLYKGLKGADSIPTNDLIPTTRSCRNHQYLPFQIPTARTDIYKGSKFSNFIR